MKRDQDGLPVIQKNSNQGLGVRSGNETGMNDVTVTADGIVELNRQGMSVAPAWRDLPIYHIPMRLQDMMEGARGSNTRCCFALGQGQFLDGHIADDLQLAVDSPRHGCIVPSKPMPLEEYESLLHATRSSWQVDER